MFTAKDVMTLREMSGAGMMDCKKALVETDGDMEKAMDYLREKSLAASAKKASRIAAEGIVDSYIHLGGKIGVLVEVNCETDFVARNADFKEFVKLVTLQIASAAPTYLASSEVPEEVLGREKEVLAAQVKGKPPQIVEKIVQGRLAKFYETCCLLEQPSVRPEHEGRKIRELLTDLIAKLGENIVIKRFTRYQLGA